MSDLLALYHGSATDSFDVIIETEYSPAYAVVHIRDKWKVAPVTIFTPRGMNCAADYLREFRDAIDVAVKELEQMGAVKEAE